MGGVSLGQTFGAALTDRGVAYTWGENREGELGVGDRISRPTPLPVALFLRAVRARPGLATDFRNEKYSPPEQSFRWTRRLHFIGPDRNPTLLFLPLRFALFLLAEVDRFGVPERARTVKPRAIAKFVPHSMALILPP